LVIGIEPKKKSIVRCHALHISDCGSKQLKSFFEKHGSKEAKARTDK